MQQFKSKLSLLKLDNLVRNRNFYFAAKLEAVFKRALDL